jgi:hypothetical protein
MATGASAYTDQRGQQNVFDLASESFLPWNVPTGFEDDVAVTSASLDDFFASSSTTFPTTYIPTIDITPPPSTSSDESNPNPAEQPAVKRAKMANHERDYLYLSPSPQHDCLSPPAEVYAMTTPFTRKLPDHNVRTHPATLAETQPGTRHASTTADSQASNLEACYFHLLDRLPAISQSQLHYGDVRPSDDLLASTASSSSQHTQACVLQLQQAAVRLHDHANRAKLHLLEMAQAHAQLEDARAALKTMQPTPEIASVLSSLTVASLVEPELRQLLLGSALAATSMTKRSGAGQDELGDFGTFFSGNLGENMSSSGFTSMDADGGLMDPTDLAHTLDQIVSSTHDSVVSSASTTARSAVSRLAVPVGHRDWAPGSPATRSRGELTPTNLEMDVDGDVKSMGSISSLAVPVSQVPRHMLFQMERFEKTK